MSDTLMISVSGMRGHVGTDLTPELVARHAAALGAWVRSARRPERAAAARGRARPRRADQRADVRPRPRRRVSCRWGWTSSTSAWCRRRRSSWRSSTITPAPGSSSPRATIRSSGTRSSSSGPTGSSSTPRPASGCARWRSRGRRARGGTASGRCAEDPEAVARHLDAILALPVIDVAAIRRRRIPGRARLRPRRRRGRRSCRCWSGSAAG